MQRFCKVAACVSANALKNAMLFRDVRHESIRHQETGEKLQRIVDGTPDMVVATDTEGRVTEFNGGAVRMTGWPALNALGRPFAAIVGEQLDADDGSVIFK